MVEEVKSLKFTLSQNLLRKSFPRTRRTNFLRLSLLRDSYILDCTSNRGDLRLTHERRTTLDD